MRRGFFMQWNKAQAALQRFSKYLNHPEFRKPSEISMLRRDFAFNLSQIKRETP